MLADENVTRRRRRDTSSLREESISDRSIREEKSIANSVMSVFVRSSVQILSRARVDSAESSSEQSLARRERVMVPFFCEL